MNMGMTLLRMARTIRSQSSRPVLFIRTSRANQVSGIRSIAAHAGPLLDQAHIIAPFARYLQEDALVDRRQLPERAVCHHNFRS